MARRTVDVKSCDKCGDVMSPRWVRISIEGERGMIANLCGGCRGPLSDLMRAVASKRKPIQSVATLKLTTMEEIEALKRSSGRSR